MDEISTQLVGTVALNHPKEIKCKLQQWIADENLWIRRTAILAQLKHKKETNEALLFELCHERLVEEEFFIQKTIGWALREYSKTKPASVIEFLKRERDNMSALTFRGGSKALKAKGLL